MAIEEKKTSFPVIPNAHWWALRKKFKQTIPGVVTDNYVASVLNMKLNSARANVLPALKATKLIDQNGAPLDRAKRWRDDAQYKAVCEEIRHDIYPEELLSGVPDPTQGKDAAKRWFANHTGAGEAAVGKMVAFYALLCEADPQKATPSSDAPTKGRSSDSPRPRSRPADTPTPPAFEPSPAPSSARPEPADVRRADHPAVHINLQIHISSDASPEQIDQVFSSMAKHIYRTSPAE